MTVARALRQSDDLQVDMPRLAIVDRDRFAPLLLIVDGRYGRGYHPRCADCLFGIRSAPRLTFTWDELNAIAEKTIRRSVAVSGVQPKLSVHLERAGGITVRSARLWRH